MHHARAITAVIACALSILSLPAARAADPATAAAAQPPAKDDTGPEKPTEVLKTKTRSNQSNDRQAVEPPPQDDEGTQEPAAVLKTKTKSNQSND